MRVAKVNTRVKLVCFRVVGQRKVDSETNRYRATSGPCCCLRSPAIGGSNCTDYRDRYPATSIRKLAFHDIWAVRGVWEWSILGPVLRSVWEYLLSPT